MSKSVIGHTIRVRRKALDIIQPTLAEMAGVSVNTLYKIERGEANPTLETLQKLAEPLGLTITLQLATDSD